MKICLIGVTIIINYSTADYYYISLNKLPSILASIACPPLFDSLQDSGTSVICSISGARIIKPERLKYYSRAGYLGSLNSIRPIYQFIYRRWD